MTFHLFTNNINVKTILTKSFPNIYNGFVPRTVDLGYFRNWDRSYTTLSVISTPTVSSINSFKLQSVVFSEITNLILWNKSESAVVCNLISNLTFRACSFQSSFYTCFPVLFDCGKKVILMIEITFKYQ